MKLPPFTGLVFMLVLFLINCGRYGTRWEFGRLGMPRSLVSSSGTYLDGAPIDPFTASLIQKGIEEEVLLVFLAFILVIAAVVAWQVRQGIRLRRELRRHLLTMKGLK